MNSYLHAVEKLCSRHRSDLETQAEDILNKTLLIEKIQRAITRLTWKQKKLRLEIDRLKYEDEELEYYLSIQL